MTLHRSEAEMKLEHEPPNALQHLRRKNERPPSSAAVHLSQRAMPVRGIDASSLASYDVPFVLNVPRTNYDGSEMNMPGMFSSPNSSASMELKKPARHLFPINSTDFTARKG